MLSLKMHFSSLLAAPCPIRVLVKTAVLCLSLSMEETSAHPGKITKLNVGIRVQSCQKAALIG